MFTVAEVARALRVSDETIRRKIGMGELEAIEVSSGVRKQYRILYRDLVAWMGADKARALFGLGEGLEEFRTFFLSIPEPERSKLIEQAIGWARSQRPQPEPTGRVLTPKQIRERFKK